MSGGEGRCGSPVHEPKRVARVSLLRGRQTNATNLYEGIEKSLRSIKVTGKIYLYIVVLPVTCVLKSAKRTSFGGLKEMAGIHEF